MLELQKFTAKNDVRLWLNSVFDIDGYLGACNGQYLVVCENSKGKHYGFPKYQQNIKTELGNKYENLIKSAFNFSELFDWHEPPEITKDMYQECTQCNLKGNVVVRGNGCVECGGDGIAIAETDYNEYEVECASCDGTGDIATGGFEKCPTCYGTKKHLMWARPKMGALEHDLWTLNAAILDKFKNLPDLKIAWVEQETLYLFKFAGGAAVVMPMRK